MATFNELQRCAREGEVNAMCELAKIYSEGKIVKQDYQKVYYWTAKANATDEKNAKVTYALGVLYFHGNGVSQSYEQAYSYWKKAAELGSEQAMYDVGHLYFEGLGTPRNFTKARQWWEQAGKAGYVDALFSLGLLYYRAQGVERNLAEAIEWWERAAFNKKDTDAILNLGALYAEYNNPLTVVSRFEYIIPLLKGLVNRKNARAMCGLGNIFYGDWVGSKSDKQAVNWWEKAAQRGDGEAAHHLGICYLSGSLGFNKDIDKARDCFEQAAKENQADAAYNLAVYHVNEASGKQDYEKAKEYYQKASDLGETSSSYRAMIMDDLAGFDDKTMDAVLPSLCELADKVNKIRERNVSEDKDKKDKSTVTHYTRHVDFLQWVLPLDEREKPVLKKNVLRLSPTQYLNDPDEGKVLIEYSKKNGFFLHNFFMDSSGNDILPEDEWYGKKSYVTFTSSFCELEDRLDLWRLYANDGKGIAVTVPKPVFDFTGDKAMFSAGKQAIGQLPINESQERGTTASSVMSAGMIRYHLYRIKYEKKDYKKVLRYLGCTLKRIFENLNSRKISIFRDKVYIIVRKLLANVLYLYKSDEYASEREYRLLEGVPMGSEKIHIDEANRLYIETEPFLFEREEFAITLGPKCKKPHEVMLEAHYRLTKFGYEENVTVRRSMINYR